MGEPVIELRHVWKAFGSIPVLRGVSLSVERGETLTILGRSGVGKSVLLKLMIGLLKPDAGTVVIEGRDIVPLSERALLPLRQRMGMLFQGSALFDSLTGADNVAYGLRVQNGLPEGEIALRVAHSLAPVGLAGIERRYPAQLSGGMKKRVALARALAIEPTILLYDEPTTGLDPTTSQCITQLIRELQGRLGVTSIVDYPKSVEVMEVEGERITLIELRVAKEDVGKVIGKQGRIADAIRTIIGAAGAKVKRKAGLESLER